jgi:hypothetical protein
MSCPLDCDQHRHLCRHIADLEAEIADLNRILEYGDRRIAQLEAMLTLERLARQARAAREAQAQRPPDTVMH